MARDELARDLAKLAVVLEMAVAALERLADDLRRPEAPQFPAAAPDRTEA